MPRNVLRGTPLATEHFFEDAPSVVTVWLLDVRKLLRQLLVYLIFRDLSMCSIVYHDNLVNSFFLKARLTMSIFPLLIADLVNDFGALGVERSTIWPCRNHVTFDL